MSAPERISGRVELNRRRFFEEIRSATDSLQDVVGTTLRQNQSDIDRYIGVARNFWNEFGKAGDGIDPHTLCLRGQPRGPDEIRRHNRKVSYIKQIFAQNPSVARLATHGLPTFQYRTGAPDDRVQELFAVETANLILARVLLLRFLEDHGFFGEKRYLCNGGVRAFQQMREYFHANYAELLKRAYEQGSRVYAAAFDETEMDWIFGLENAEMLSRAIEWTLFRFARYDFATIKGDILTGIYDRFLDRDKRKRFGEFYTPPSIARYIVQRIGVGRNSLVLDPACGSGTFLIESYRHAVGSAVERGAAEYTDARDALARIRGNDLNTFSAVLTQIQLLWQVLGFKRDIEHQGFPDIAVTANVNSLVQRDLFGSVERFTELDVHEYDAVVGNPPYVRAERSAQDLDPATLHYFQGGGISGKLNTFALFLYRALDRWCKKEDENGPAGKVGFVLPVSLFDSNDTADLRKLFAIGGRWTIREIVDLEAIYRDVFDADVLPAIVIAENRPARDNDIVSVRFADTSCVRQAAPGAVPEFALEGLAESSIPYTAIFSPDGRILTRLTERRLSILRKLWTNETWFAAAKRIWIQKKGSRIADWTDQEPTDLSQWEERRLCTGGLAFRGKKAQAAAGLDVFKGENIVATEVQGEPALTGVDLAGVDDPGPWRYANILPDRAYAVARVAHCPNAAPFNPHCTVFTNTATVYFPRTDLTGVPFDLLLLSDIYVWFYALAARMGVLRTFRSDIYPTNLALLPWNDALRAQAQTIEDMRSGIIAACRNVVAAQESLWSDLGVLKLRTLKERVRENPDARLTWSDSWDDPDYEVEIHVGGTTKTEDGVRVHLSRSGPDWVSCSQSDFAHGLSVALRQYKDRPFTKSTLLNLPIPVDTREMAQWTGIVAEHNPEKAEEHMRQALGRLDEVVGTALGLTHEDILEIQRDLRADPFLQKIRPRYPGTVTRKQGFRTGLDSEARYE